MRKGFKVAAILLTAGLASPASAVLVDQLQPGANCNTMGADEWCINLQAGAGDASIVDLTGAGGDLETNQPAPIGAARLSTGASTSDRAEIGTNVQFGASSFLNSAQLGYSYFKQTTGATDENLFAAPSLKLAIFAAGCGAGVDCFGQLIYEPNWNQGTGGSSQPPADAWQDVLIDSSTGAGGTSDGGWWWTGGFGEASGAGGPPIRSLAEWDDLFTNGSLATEYADANVVFVSVGLGTFNLENVGYVDNVIVGTTGGSSTTYDFEPASAVSAPASLGLLVAGLVGAGAARRRAV